MNALAAFGHRSDVCPGWVTPRGALGDYRLYKGVMRDEGPTGEGRDHATMVWNRQATYNPAAPPTTYFSLVDLNLQLYHEDDEMLVSYNVTPLTTSNRSGSRPAPATPPWWSTASAWSTSFFHGIPAPRHSPWPPRRAHRGGSAGLLSLTGAGRVRSNPPRTSPWVFGSETAQRSPATTTPWISTFPPAGAWSRETRSRTSAQPRIRRNIRLRRLGDPGALSDSARAGDHSRPIHAPLVQ